MPRIKSIEQLRRELQAKETVLSKIQAKRNKLTAKLETLDRQIAQLTGGAASDGRRRPGPTRGPGRPPGGRGKPLLEFIKAVLAKAPSPMRIKEIMKAVTKAGYKTVSKDFYGIVAAAVRDTRHFKKVKRGVYKLA